MRTRIKNKVNILKEVEMIAQQEETQKLRKKEIQKLTEQFKTDSISWMCAKKWATSMYDYKQLTFK